MDVPYLLPDGRYTRSVGRYCREWNSLAKPVAKALGCKVIGMNPSIHLMPINGNRGFQLPVSVAQRIKALVEDSKNYRRKPKPNP